jgi:hypothetical protein
VTSQNAVHLRGASVFLSASIPAVDRWTEPFDPLEITDAVVAATRAILGAGGRIVTAAHPTIAPLLWFTASELEPAGEPAVVIYQSSLFEEVLPEATRLFDTNKTSAQVIRVPAADGERVPDPRLAPVSLAELRRRMLTDQPLVAAIFIGGMAGVADEHALFAQLHPTAPHFALRLPGGAAASLESHCPDPVRQSLMSSNVYPTIAREIVRCIADWMETRYMAGLGTE